MSSTARRGWRRRLVVWPLVVLGTPLVLAISPLLFATAMVLDLLTGPRRLRFVRLTGMGLNYLVLTFLGLVSGFVLWVATGFGLAVRARWSQRAHHRVQMLWTKGMLNAVQRWLGAEVHIEGAELAAAGPAVVLARHASFFDAVVPSVVIGPHDRAHLRHVLKVGLLWEPSLDVFGRRLPNTFVARGGSRTTATLDDIRRLATDLGDDFAVIFPEGTFRSSRRAESILDRFREREPDRARRLDLRHLLPAQRGGTLALLEGADDADLVIIGHIGFEPFGSFRSILANVPFRREVHIRIWRIHRDAVPDHDEGRLALIDEEWQRLDDWIEHHVGGKG